LIVYCSIGIVDGAGYVVDGARVVNGAGVENAGAAGILNCDGAGVGEDRVVTDATFAGILNCDGARVVKGGAGYVVDANVGAGI